VWLLAAYRQTHSPGRLAWSKGRGPLAAVPHSSHEPGEFLQLLCHDDSSINIVLVIIIIIIISQLLSVTTTGLQSIANTALSLLTVVLWYTTSDGWEMLEFLIYCASMSHFYAKDMARQCCIWRLPVWCDHQRPRAKKASKIVPDISLIVQTPVTDKQQVYWANTSNKAKFISLLISHLRTEGFIVVEATADVDAEIV